ncbi:uncharacterized protein K460DRAFT_148160 [Cucurbitaria berberidis CBS 394.84]|uniref:Uncharacterized protein n=1 Tax=Cucurbitaria berberidis CBS 394.84 TaxID=1168544 RepID=A0A9P4GCX2_9PLEO|nr:uncharacterized protein K460DRAFT_148160 [Cucurbitaria berberidis CBS 394.84]KAF1843588.1 hypothetical protein K460DRAFT_148160 [Cucurbitaria berberidis CBS 394.84]
MSTVQYHSRYSCTTWANRYRLQEECQCRHSQSSYRLCSAPLWIRGPSTSTSSHFKRQPHNSWLRIRSFLRP